MKVVRTDTEIHVRSGVIIASVRGVDNIRMDPEIRITNESDRARLDGLSIVALDVTRIDDIIEALEGLKAELVAASPRTAKEYVEERDLGGDHWREGRTDNV